MLVLLKCSHLSSHPVKRSQALMEMFGDDHVGYRWCAWCIEYVALATWRKDPDIWKNFLVRISS
jgi:hypothetical protein